MPMPPTQQMDPMTLAALMQAYGTGMGGGLGQRQQSPAGIGGPQLVAPQPRMGSMSPGGALPMAAPLGPQPNAQGSPLGGMNPQQLMQLWKMIKGGGGPGSGGVGMGGGSWLSGIGSGSGGLLGALGATGDTGLMAAGGGYAGLLGGSLGTGAAVGSSGASFADLLAAGAIAV